MLQFQSFLLAIVDSKTLRIVDTSRYSELLSTKEKKDLILYLSPVIVDPGNPFNYFRKSDIPWESLVFYAQETLNRLRVFKDLVSCLLNINVG